MEGCEHGEVAAGGFAADEAGEVLVWGRCRDLFEQSLTIVVQRTISRSW